MVAIKPAVKNKGWPSAGQMYMV